MRWISSFVLLPLLVTSGSFASDVARPLSHEAASTKRAEFNDCKGASWCPTMVTLPAGDFPMGAPENEVGRYPEEGPVHRVHVPTFALAKWPVTRGQYAEFSRQTNRKPRGGCSWTGRTGSDPDPKGTWQDPGFEQADDHPVVCVTWSDAQDYVAWLSARTGKRYRLPSEAEWEYAARAGTTTAFHWGNEPSHDHANYGSDKCCGTGVADGADHWVQTSPVAAFPANAFGVQDMLGNAMEYVADCLSLTYAGLPVDGSAYSKSATITTKDPDLAPLNGTDTCAYRIIRGGNWGDAPGLIRSASRNWTPPPGATLQGYSSAGLGLRVARDLR